MLRFDKKLNKRNLKTHDQPFDQLRLSKNLDDNIQTLKGIFDNDDTFIVRTLQNKYLKTAKGALIYLLGMGNVDVLNRSIIEPFLRENLQESISENNLLNDLREKVLIANRIEYASKINDISDELLNGKTIFLLEGFDQALIISSKGWETRGIEEPESEKVVRGPREGFNEDLLTNVTLLRRKIKNPSLKIFVKEIGDQTRTKICVCYMEGITPQKILDEVLIRLEKIDIDGVLDSGYIQELIKDAPHSPFETIGSTERPDVVAGKLLEGRVAIIVDGSPFVLTLPYLLIENFQVNEDYYNYYYYSTVNRILRIIGELLTISVPAIYVALVTFHQEMIPTPLLLSISAARQGVPFPTILEAVGMLFTFEILREAGVRMPTPIGQAVSIVGALVLGQAAVDARIVSAPMVIITAITGITALLSLRLQGANIIFRLIFLLAASFLGIFGVIFAFVGLVIHLMNLRSFGIPYMLNIASLKSQEIKDTVIRAPVWYMQARPFIMGVKNISQQGRSKKRGKKRGQ